MGFREDAIYDMDLLTSRLLAYVHVQDREDSSERGLMEAARRDSRMLTAYIANAIRRDEDFLMRCARRLDEYPMETAAALYLDCMDK